MCQRLIFAASLLVFVSVATGADPLAEQMGAPWAKKWGEKNKEFVASRDKAKAAVLGELDKAIEKVDKQPALTAAARTDRRNELAAARKAFAEKGALPPDDEFIPLEFGYFTKLNKAALPVSVLIDEAVEKGAKDKNDALEKLGLKMKADLETELGGESRLVANSVWKGELRRAGGNTIPYHLHVTKMGAGGLFKAHVEDNPGVQGNWSYDVEGQTRALGLQYKLSKNLRGSLTAVAVEGIVSGDRLIANITQVAGRGKPGSALIVLKRVK